MIDLELFLQVRYNTSEDTIRLTYYSIFLRFSRIYATETQH